MTLATKTLGLALCLMASVALAKEGVQDATVKARMDLMDANGANLKYLHEVAEGRIPFDATKADVAKSSLVAASKLMEERFEDNASDPVSVARPDIWTNWADFVARSAALNSAAKALDDTSVDGIKAGLGAINTACKDCHRAYKI